MHELAAHPLVEDLLQRAKFSAKLDGDAWTEAGFDESLEGVTVAQRTWILTARTCGDRQERHEEGALASFGVPKQRRVLHALTDVLHGAIVVSVPFLLISDPIDPMTDDDSINAEAARRLVEDAAIDATSRRARERVCQSLAAVLKVAAQLLWVGGSMLGTDRRDGESPFGFGSDAAVGLSVVVQIAGDLLTGTVALLSGDNLYGAAALLRQAVEVEYLAWAFAEDEQEAANWMRSTSEGERRMWTPKHLRDRSAGRFRASDYHGHCERGGHPTPEATLLLAGHSRRQSPELLRLDLAEHGVSTWRYVEAAAHRLKYQDEMQSIADAHGLHDAIACWERDDRLRIVARHTLKAFRSEMAG